MKLPLHPAALDELDEAVEFIEKKRAGYGERLFAHNARRVEQAARFPTSGPLILGFDKRYDVRQFVTKPFSTSL